MKPITKCKCGNNIVLALKKSYKVVNKRKLCLRCFNNKDLRRIALGARSFFPAVGAAARFNTLCSLQRELKHLLKTMRDRDSA